MEDFEKEEVFEHIEEFIEELVKVWFVFMKYNAIALDPTEDIARRRNSAIVCEEQMAKRYKMIERIDEYFENGLVYHV